MIFIFSALVVPSECQVLDWLISKLGSFGRFYYCVIYWLLHRLTNWFSGRFTHQLTDRLTEGPLHQCDLTLVWGQIWLWAQFSHNLHFTNAIQVRVRVDLAPNLNRRLTLDQILISVQLIGIVGYRSSADPSSSWCSILWIELGSNLYLGSMSMSIKYLYSTKSRRSNPRRWRVGDQTW